MKSRAICILVAMCALSMVGKTEAQIESTPFGKVVKTQLNMIALPPSWQPYIGPGSVIFVRWEPKGPMIRGVPTLGFRFIGKNLDNPPDNLPATTIHPLPTVTSMAVQHLKSTGVDLSVALGKFNPSVLIGSGSRLNLDQTTFSAAGWGTDLQITRRALASPTLHDDLTNGVYDTIVDGDHRMFQGFGQGYIVTSVFTVEKMHVDITSQTQVEASLQALKPGECKNSVPASQIPKPKDNSGADPTTPPPTTKTPNPPVAPNTQPAAGPGVTGSAKGSGGAAPDAKTTFSGIVFSDAQVKVCRFSNTAYDINVSPGVPIAFTAVEIQYRGMEPFGVAGGKIQDLRDAMKFPD